jgi:putative oxidoreductase
MGGAVVQGGVAVNLGVVVIRVVFGLLMAAHGSQKLFGWFGGHGLAAVAGMFESLGFRPGRVLGITAGLAEVVGGVLMAAGLFGPVGPALVLSVMIVAAISVHWPNGLFAMSNGIELPLLYGTVSAGLALTGPGRWSADGLVGLDSVCTPTATLVVLAIGVFGGVANLALRRLPVPARAAA